MDHAAFLFLGIQRNRGMKANLGHRPGMTTSRHSEITLFSSDMAIGTESFVPSPGGVAALLTPGSS